MCDMTQASRTRSWASVVVVLVSLTLQAEEAAPAKEAAFLERFEKEIWPLLSRDEGGEGKDSCVGCHGERNRSELHYYPDPKSNFRMLASQRYFDPENPDSLLARVSSTNPRRRMPPFGRTPWSGQDIDRLRAFVETFADHKNRETEATEGFPVELLEAYSGPTQEGLDNTFLSYRQLRGKILTIFGDDGIRGERDLFEENIALLGGADFKGRFNERPEATAGFLSALDTLATSVASRAYLQKMGPFAGRASDVFSPLSQKGSVEAWRGGIRGLYRSIVFRDPTDAEFAESIQLLNDIVNAKETIRTSRYTLGFTLTVDEETTGFTSSHDAAIPVLGGGLGLYQTSIDQSVESDDKIAEATLGRLFNFRPNDMRQHLRMSNFRCRSSVSFHGLRLLLQDAKAAGQSAEPLVLTVDDPTFAAEGDWGLNRDGDFSSYEVGGYSKRESVLRLPIDVPVEGVYEVTVLWRRNKNNGRAVPVELVSHDHSRLAYREPFPPPAPPGEFRYWVDQRDDTVAFWDLEASFQFGPDDYVEINNAGTEHRVIADSVKFVSRSDGGEILVDNHEADGRDGWLDFPRSGSSNYNRVGPDVFQDDQKRKGEMSIRYRPSIKRDAWRERDLYRVHIGNPGRSGNEPRTPIVIKASASAPIIRVIRPVRAAVGATIKLDASGTFTLQRGPLRFRWAQHRGPRIGKLYPTLDDRGRLSIVTFVAPLRDAYQEAWVALSRVLMNHPDFLFTRPPSVGSTTSVADKRRLQLMKLALDLVGRPPSAAEVELLERPTSLEAMVDTYLHTKDFEDFYFRRIRLYLESHGSPVQDEPARLWCYVAFNDHPFQEILTGDYTVDTSWRKQPRPEHHGKTGILTTAGFIQGKPGLPHYNYPAQVAEKFLGYVFEVPDAVVEDRENTTALSTTAPDSVCYSCHKLLTPLAHQRLRWDDEGRYRAQDENGESIDDSDRGLVAAYPYQGNGIEAFSTRAVRKERFIRTMVNTHFIFFFGREMRYRKDERTLYREIWDRIHVDHFTIRSLIRTIVLSPEYLEGRPRSTRER